MEIPYIETASQFQIQEFQEKKLREAVQYAAANSPFYKKIFKEYSIDGTGIKTLADLQKLPFTTKQQLQQYNNDFLCVPRHKIIDYATTSGTSGRPVTMALTDNDLERLAYNEDLSLSCSGIQQGDAVQLMTTQDRQFMAGLAYFMGLRKLGAGVIRTGAGLPQMQWNAILTYKPDYIIAVPSFLLKLIEYAQANNIDYKNCSVRGAVCIGEPLRNTNLAPNTLAEKITGNWNIKLFSTYASTEMATAFAECEHGQGGHLHPELIIAEVINNDDKPVQEGETGELVITTLGVEGMPLLRFKTGDMVQMHTTPCACGRTTPRIGPVTGRKQQMIKLKGTTLYPPAFSEVMQLFTEVQSHIIEVSYNNAGNDEVLVKICTDNPCGNLLHTIKETFKSKLRVTPNIEFVTHEEINRLMLNPEKRKPVTFIDRRC